MYRLLESIKVENGKLFQIDYHNARFNEARKALFGSLDFVDIASIVKLPIENGLFKLRVLTDGENIGYELIAYERRVVKTLKLIVDNHIDYAFKTENRQGLNGAFAKRGKADDVIIVKGNFITDASASNILLFDGNSWVTPDTPLLKGTQRAYLLDMGLISERSIQFEDLFKYKAIKLVNAMMAFEQAPMLYLPNCIID